MPSGSNEQSEEPEESPRPTFPLTPTGAAPTLLPTLGDDLAWRRLNPSGDAPAAREDHTWTVDPSSGLAYLFGGRDGSTSFDDLWAFDPAATTWQLLHTEGDRPGARFGHGAVWVPGTGLVVWAGQGSQFYDDLWAYDPVSKRWRELPGEGDRPPARYGSCLALGPDGRLWISHGFTHEDGRFSDTRAYDLASGTWTVETTDGPKPVVRCLHDCLWTPDGRLVLYGGQTTGTPALGDLWTRTVSGGWTEVPDAKPAPRQLYAVATLGSRAIVFGGGANNGSFRDDLWALDLGDPLNWTRLRPAGDGPSARSGAAMIATEAGTVLLFGGRNALGGLADLWELSPAA